MRLICFFRPLCSCVDCFYRKIRDLIIFLLFFKEISDFQFNSVWRYHICSHHGCTLARQPCECLVARRARQQALETQTQSPQGVPLVSRRCFVPYVLMNHMHNCLKVRFLSGCTSWKHMHTHLKVCLLLPCACYPQHPDENT